MSDPPNQAIDLRGRKVLIAEPNPLIALDLVATVSGWGGEPIVLDDNFAGPHDTAIEGIDVALVDVAVPPKRHADLVELLRLRGIRTVLTTTGQTDSVAAQFPGMTVFEKPVDYAALSSWFAAADGTAF